MEEKLAISVKELSKLLGIHVSKRRMIIPMEGLKKWLASNGGQNEADKKTKK